MGRRLEPSGLNTGQCAWDTFGLDKVGQIFHCRECIASPFAYGEAMVHLLIAEHTPAYRDWLITALLEEGYTPDAGEGGLILAALAVSEAGLRQGPGSTSSSSGDGQ